MREFPRYIQIHSLHGYPAVLLNRDDAGLAKRLVYGGASRTRISSQCLKRRWRTADSEHGIERIDTVPRSIRSRQTITRLVAGPLRKNYPKEIVDIIETGFQTAVYGKEEREQRQTLLLGEEEVEYLAREARKIAKKHGASAAKTKRAVAAWAGSSRENLAAMRAACSLPGGLWSALSGRMVTADPAANIEAALQVAHSMTTHREEAEGDFFSVVDDLHRPGKDATTDYIGETEITSGVFYGYVVIDRAKLVANLGGDEETAGEIARRLVHLIATVTPGAKRGATAPYSYAAWMLVEAGDAQPRSLAEAFRKPVAEATATASAAAAAEWIVRCDRAYGKEGERRLLSLVDNGGPHYAERTDTLAELAGWTGQAAGKGLR